MKTNIKISKPSRKKVVNWILGFLSVFFLLLVIGYFVVRSNIDTLTGFVNAALEEQINGKVTIGDIDITILNHFPRFSLSVRDVVIADASYPEHELYIFKAEKVYLQIRVLALLKKKVELRAITLKDAEINLMRMPDGGLNSKGLIKPKEKVVPAEEKDISGILISRIYLQNVHLNYVDNIWGKKYDITFKDSYGKLEHGSTISTIETKDKIYVAGLTFKPNKGSCLTNKTLHTKLEFEWDRVARTILIKPSTIEVDKNKLSINGSVSPGITPFLKLELASKGIKMDYALTLVSDSTRQKLNGYNFEDPIPVKIKIEGAFNPGLPMSMDLYFNVTDNTFTTPSKKFEEVSLVGHFFNHLNDTLINDEKNSGITFTSFTGTYEGIPVAMDLRVTDLTDPYMAVHINSNVHLKDVNASIDTSTLKFTGGDLKLDVDFKGKMKGYMEKDKDSMDAVINGTAIVTNAACNFPLKRYSLKDIKANIVFNEKSLQVNQLAFNINNNPVNITASISQFIYVFFFPNAKLKAEATVNATHFNLDNFYKPTIIQKKGNSGKKMAAIVSTTLENLEGNLMINAGKVSYHKLIAENVNGNITIGNTYIVCNNVSMNIAGGSFALNGNIKGIGSALPAVNFNTTIKGADISTLFYQLDNFNQTAITSANLKGKLDAKADFATSLNKNFLVDPKTMKGDLNLVVREGELINMASLNQISKNVFKKKDFSDIQFAELNTIVSLKGNEFQIAEMVVQSNVLSLYVNGIYSFGENTELFIKVPVKSLKSKEEDYIAEYEENNDKIGMSINLKATKQNGKLKVTPLLFKKKDNKVLED